ncbi:MAG: winged helix-turn-helix transcriptional regulator [Nanoarchaeota archaeon]
MTETGYKNDQLRQNIDKRIGEKEKLILTELVKNPRISDNMISKKTGIPVKTVNRKRNYLEKKRLIGYSTYINNFETGTGRFNATSMYTIRFKFGITKEQIKSVIISDRFRTHRAIVKHILFDFVGEKEGSATYTVIIISRAASDLIEILNAEIVPFFKGLENNPILKIEENTVGFFNKTGHNNYVSWFFSGEKSKELKDNEIYIFD